MQVFRVRMEATVQQTKVTTRALVQTDSMEQIVRKVHSNVILSDSNSTRILDNYP